MLPDKLSIPGCLLRNPLCPLVPGTLACNDFASSQENCQRAQISFIRTLTVSQILIACRMVKSSLCACGVPLDCERSAADALPHSERLAAGLPFPVSGALGFGRYRFVTVVEPIF